MAWLLLRWCTVGWCTLLHVAEVVVLSATQPSQMQSCPCWWLQGQLTRLGQHSGSALHCHAVPG